MKRIYKRNTKKLIIISLIGYLINVRKKLTLEIYKDRIILYSDKITKTLFFNEIKRILYYDFLDSSKITLHTDRNETRIDVTKKMKGISIDQNIHNYPEVYKIIIAGVKLHNPDVIIEESLTKRMKKLEPKIAMSDEEVMRFLTGQEEKRENPRGVFRDMG